MKSFTDLNQSKKLAEILPIESADMEYMFLKKDGSKVSNVPFVKDGFEEPECCYSFIPCWSLAALLNAVDFNTINLHYGNARIDWVASATIHDSTKHCTKYESTRAINSVDACYEMIIKLHKEGLL